MPYNAFHLHIAQKNLSNLKGFDINKQLGLYFLGSVFPDAHAFVDPELQKRSQFHFQTKLSDLFFPVKQLFKSKPWNFKKQSHRAFYLGYASHLLTDQVHIHLIYLPFFKDQPLKHDVFRFYLNSLYSKTSQKTVSFLKTAKSKQLADLFSLKLLNQWKKLTIKQVKLLPSPTKYFNALVGDKKRYLLASKKYQKVLPLIQAKINKNSINKLEKSILKLLTLSQKEILNPKSIIKSEDII